MAVGIALDDKIDYRQFQDVIKNYADKNEFKMTEILNVKQDSPFSMDIYLEKQNGHGNIIMNIPFNERFRVFQIYYPISDDDDKTRESEKQVTAILDIFEKRYGIVQQAWFDEREKRERRRGGDITYN